MSRVCVFCGGVPVTKEHVWPHWAQSTVPTSTPTPIQRIVELEGQAGFETSWLGQAFSETCRTVCAICNNGWMSRLETATKELFVAMNGGGPLTLDREMQKTLAAWALKTVIMHDLAQVGPWSPTDMPDDLKDLARTGAPSDRVVVSLSSCMDSPPAQARLWGTCVRVHDDLRSSTRDAPLLGATISLGPVCFQVLYSAIPDMPEAFAREERPAITLIWPYRAPFDWTTRAEFLNHDLLDLAEAVPTIVRSALMSREHELAGVAAGSHQ